MDNETVFKQVVTILKVYVKDEAALESATGATSLLDDLQVNSARLVDIILAIEDEFDIEVDDESADKVRTLQDAVDLIVARKAG